MHFDNGGVQTHRLGCPLIQSLVLQMIEHLCKYAAMTPTVKPHVYRVPGAKVSGQRPPFAPVAGHVGQCVKEPVVADKSAVMGLGSR